MKQQKPLEKKNSFNTYARYSGMAFQMIAIIALGSYFGVKLDEKFPNEKNWYTIALSLTAVILSIVVVIRNINSVSKDTSNE